MRSSKILLIAAALVAYAGVSYGLTPSEIVARSKSSVVAIIEENTTTGEYWEGTGWFITGNRIVTNEHVVNNPHPFDRLRIVNVATKQEYTSNHIAYRNETTDVAVIVVNESNATHLNLSSRNPALGMNVIVIGNPLKECGKATSGTITEVFNQGTDKRTNALVLDAGIQQGSSGSPVLDYKNGDVIGMIWGADDSGDGTGAAVQIKTLELARVDVVETKVALALSPDKPAPRAELVVPRAQLVEPETETETFSRFRQEAVTD